VHLLRNKQTVYFCHVTAEGRICSHLPTKEVIDGCISTSQRQASNCG